ncbi:MAG TPA: 3-oxoacyl-[acyl-carrier-protein] synthase III C-terminal domain-containing protein [Stellaceae bacterium]|jgi:3-oxoacyl-[acyl-carrier-protein] synthase-3
MNELRDVFITGAGTFLPGKPVGVDQMEDHLGRIYGRASLLGRRALRWNGVASRHYAMLPDGTILHTNADMCARAVAAALDDSGDSLRALGFLAAATTQGDYLVPGHAAAVQGALAGPPMEIASFQSACGSALMAAKAAWLAVRTGEHDLGVACAGEFSSRWFRPEFYEGTTLCDTKGRLCAEADFLRFTLSDGAGAIVCAPRPRRDGLCLRIRYIDIVSLAGSFDPCMWAGAALNERDDPAKSWAHRGPRAAHAAGAIALLQDFQLLKKVIRAWVGVYLKKVDEGRIVPSEIDWLLCHYSAESLREEIVSLLEDTAGMVPAEKWFSVLREKGNVGAASIWIMLDAFLRSGRAERGQKALCIVPESGRALVGFLMAEVI